MLSSFITELRTLFSHRCEMWKSCGLYQEDAWTCNEDVGFGCGKAREASAGKYNKENSQNLTLKVTFEETTRDNCLGARE